LTKKVLENVFQDLSECVKINWEMNQEHLDVKMGIHNIIWYWYSP